METGQVADLGEGFPDALRAERKDDNTLILRKLDSPVRRFDGRAVSYELEYRWHRPGTPVECMQGQEFTFWSRRELIEAGAFRRSLFESFRLY